MKPLHVTLGLCLGFIALVVGLFVYSVTRTPMMSEDELRTRGVLLLPVPRELPPFVLETADGEVFDNASLQGVWTFIFFGFTNCPDICPTTMAVMGQAQTRLLERDDQLAEVFRGVLVSVDPEHDTPELLARYTQAFSGSLTGVRGSVAGVAELAKSLHVAFAKVPITDANGNTDPNSYSVDHSANIVIINPRGHYHGFIKYPQQADTIAAALQTLASNF
jgi:protein SCO1/2